MPTTCWALKCTTQASFNHECRMGAMYCRRHADDSMVNVVSRRCAHAEGCKKRPSFNHADRTTGAYCREHAQESMVNVQSERCAYAGCSATYPKWGYWADGKGTFCAEHKGDLTDGLVMDYGRKCKTKGVKGCFRTVRWGVDGEHPTHCDKHGASSAGFVRVPSGRTKTSAYYCSPGTTMGRCHAARAGEREDEAENTAGVAARGSAAVESSHLGRTDDF